MKKNVVICMVGSMSKYKNVTLYSGSISVNTTYKNSYIVTLIIPEDNTLEINDGVTLEIT